ncbi:MAG: hypothetical protein H7Z18_07200 [Methylophilaceae bacterium]|nr:hypothetical protein [Methylophilaceae bacterium]
MKNTNKLSVIALAASLAFLSISASAGQDEIQRQMTQRAYKLQQQTKAVEAAKQEATVIKQAECMRQMELSNNAKGT